MNINMATQIIITDQTLRIPSYSLTHLETTTLRSLMTNMNHQSLSIKMITAIRITVKPVIHIIKNITKF